MNFHILIRSSTKLCAYLRDKEQNLRPFLSVYLPTQVNSKRNSVRTFEQQLFLWLEFGSRFARQPETWILAQE